VAEVKAIKVR